MSYLKRIVKSGLRRAGLDIHRFNPALNPSYHLLKGMQRFGVDFVFDVGANAGQFASELRSLGYTGELLSFEPLSEAHRALESAAARDRAWRVHPRGAIGNIDGEVVINVAGNSVSSSVLPMMESHSLAAAESAYIGCEKVPMFKLDTITRDFHLQKRRPFLKVDAQGFEWQVLEGARETLPHLVGLLVEASLVPLYEGQRLWLEMIRRLEGEGFTLWSIARGFTDPRDGRTLQIDATFFRASM